MRREPECQRRKKEARKDEELEGITEPISLYSSSVLEEDCSRRVKILRAGEAVAEEAVADEEMVDKGVVEVMGKCPEKEEAMELRQGVEVEKRAKTVVGV